VKTGHLLSSESPSPCIFSSSAAHQSADADEFGNASRIQGSSSTFVPEAQNSDMLRPLFNVLLNPCSIITPLLLKCTQADTENSEMLGAFNDCSNFCSSTKFGHATPNVQRSAEPLFHCHSIVAPPHPS
jgi:hypothetical protein